jgi:hypothetical protein
MWAGVAFAAGLVAWRRHVTLGPAPGLRPTDSFEWIAILIIVGMAAVTLVSAISAAPATWDAHVYHLSRIAHWIQNRNVAPYPTQIPRQLWSGPGAEYVVAHFEILTGSDRVVTLVQWLAFMGNILVASHIAAQLGAGRRGQLVAALAVATLPGAVAQASGAQVELLAAFWLSCAVSLFLEFVVKRNDGVSLVESVLFGLSIGLAILTKATAYLFFAPFVAWGFVNGLRHSGARALRTWLVAGVTALAVLTPQYLRNLAVFGSPLGIPGAEGTVNNVFSPGALASNLVRNTALHFGTRTPAINRIAYDAVVGVHQGMGVDVNDPRTTFAGEPFRTVRLQYAEQTAGSPIQVLLFAGSLITLVFHKRPRPTIQLTYGLAILTGFLLFCLVLKWQPWHARLHVPLLVVAAPFIGYVLGGASRWPAQLFATVMAVGALPALLLNPARPLLLHTPIFSIPREQQYFAEYPQWYASYAGAADNLQHTNCRRIGLKIGGNDFEYALWALLERRFGAAPLIRHVQVSTASAHGIATKQERFEPCAIIYIHSAPRQRPFVAPPGFQLSWQKDSVRVFLTERK